MYILLFVYIYIYICVYACFVNYFLLTASTWKKPVDGDKYVLKCWLHLIVLWTQLTFIILLFCCFVLQLFLLFCSSVVSALLLFCCFFFCSSILLLSLLEHDARFGLYHHLRLPLLDICLHLYIYICLCAYMNFYR